MSISYSVDVLNNLFNRNKFQSTTRCNMTIEKTNLSSITQIHRLCNTLQTKLKYSITNNIKEAVRLIIMTEVF